jgi:uncharacterized protein involved in outer membrane biogenesis
MKKFIYVCVGFFAICLTAFGFSYWKLNSLAKFAIEEAGTLALKTKVEVSRVSLMPFSGKGAIHGFKVHNPPGYISKYAVEVGKVEVQVKLSELKNKIVEISKVEVAAPTIFYEGRGTENNFTKLQANAQSTTAKNEKQKGNAKSDFTFLLKEFLMTKSLVHMVNVIPGQTKAIELADIQFKNAGNMSQADLIAKLSGTIAGNVAKEGLRTLASPDQIKKQVLDKVKAPDALKKLF